jgi:N-methylhydantoinase A
MTEAHDCQDSSSLAPERARGSGARRVQIGVDIGGTFTDLVAIDGLGEPLHLKTPTVAEDPVRGVAFGVKWLAQRGLEGAQIDYVVHGTTLAINTIIQRSGARVALLVTEGFRDVLELGRLRLPQPWSFYSARPQSLVPRELVVPVRERTRVDGTVETALSKEEVDHVCAQVDALRVDSVAICLLHAYRFPQHELALEAALAERVPHVLISRSSAIWPESREYERALVTVINAYVQPAMTKYLGRLEAALSEAGVAVRPYITKSNGGIMSADAAGERVVQTLLSGPAAGVVGALEIAGRVGADNVITLDVGGTSADVAVIRGGVPAASHEARVGDFTVVMPTVGVSTIGAGGGSVAWVDATNVLKVGPRSAGSFPGPACYANGGIEPTLTDAFLVAGYLAADRFAGRVRLDVSLARLALADLGKRVHFGVEEAADAVIRVALANMFAELSSVIEGHGIDQREYTLLPLGGAGPVLAAQLADELHMSRVLIPRWPGTLCAWGALHADVSSDFIRSVSLSVRELTSEWGNAVAQELASEGRDWIQREAPTTADHELRWSADMHYHGQSYEIEELTWLCSADAGALERAFHKSHERVFSHSDPSGAVEITNVRVRALGTVRGAEGPTVLAPASSRETIAFSASRRARSALFSGAIHKTTIYDRAELGIGVRLEGPAVIEQEDSTVVVPPRWSAEVGAYESLLLVKSGKTQ